ncbi:thiol-disulfide isomerase/thioredoxin [Ancylobacter sp. 3268]|uniref:TlpA family protein disulfide reductase n=1 Tax=Ancylobacter sp. 3268 TaxID=2817752 RepID=UPI002863EDCC|nr:TlpA disulfide reductase family protein [Ancylobacter sp. 3268]MDR6955705.1 thiol-disulfide isomerase/thioredoxin [Ancylobacter sp. 3268]
MLDSSAPACRGSTSPLLPFLLIALASFSLDAGSLLHAETTLVPGAQPPPLALASLDHGPQRLDALHGRPVIVHFFATWCEPCREEMAGLRRLAGRFAGMPAENRPAILAIDVGEPVTRIRRFLARDIAGGPLPFPILIDEDRAAMKAWKVAFLPTSHVLGADHTLRFSATGPVDWDDARIPAALDSLLATATPAVAFTLPALPDNSGSPQQ